MMQDSSQNSTQPDIVTGTSYTMPVYMLTAILSGHKNDPAKDAFFGNPRSPKKSMVLLYPLFSGIYS
jgi:hypothetical protein